MTRRVIGYDADGHTQWSDNDPGGKGVAPLIVNVTKTKVFGYSGGTHLRDKDAIRSVHPTTSERARGTILR